MMLRSGVLGTNLDATEACEVSVFSSDGVAAWDPLVVGFSVGDKSGGCPPSPGGAVEGVCVCGFSVVGAAEDLLATRRSVGAVVDSFSATVGSGVGTSVGDSVGDSVGVSEGDSVGTSEGDNVGASVGESVGESDGDELNPCLDLYDFVVQMEVMLAKALAKATLAELTPCLDLYDFVVQMQVLLAKALANATVAEL
eukprot:CAMPEP_0201617214 /NCGR_PEP_ID=MMETSP0492-20130828/35792_1 /ASSEMBLY_ACC=CAM_ASM_000837 /TAXON_ID=420259 /ORGANISM="Thalassiosira gravida, Strain GMp14c1" /LENGTH=196 /DNA_ID=CAMNT_0048085401 /DNA_START=660 /DNA_END=1247 /DNA_ORIENTATION=+